MKIKIWFLLLATVPLALSPVFRLIDNHLKVMHAEAHGGLGLAAFGFGISNLFHYAFIVLVCIFGSFLFFRLQNGTIVLSPIKLFPQWDGATNNIIRVLGYIQIYISCYSIKQAMPVSYRVWMGPYELLGGIFGLIGAILYVLVFCSVEPK